MLVHGLGFELRPEERKKRGEKTRAFTIHHLQHVQKKMLSPPSITQHLLLLPTLLLPTLLLLLLILQPVASAWPGKEPSSGNGHTAWIYPHITDDRIEWKHSMVPKREETVHVTTKKSTYEKEKTNVDATASTPNSDLFRAETIKPVVNTFKQRVQKVRREKIARESEELRNSDVPLEGPRFMEGYDMLDSNSRVHAGRVFLPGWEDHIVSNQKFDDPHWKWVQRSNSGSTLPRHYQLIHPPPPFHEASTMTTSFIEQQSNVLPPAKALHLRASMLRKFGGAVSSASKSSSIEAPKYQDQKLPRFAQAGAQAGAQAEAQAGKADPWWLNPPPWWLPPPPEWGSPPPSVYSPFYSPGNIQQPGGAAAHNSYPAYTPTPPPY